jgi:hypothetical protein
MADRHRRSARRNRREARQNAHPDGRRARRVLERPVQCSAPIGAAFTVAVVTDEAGLGVGDCVAEARDALESLRPA